ncbi:MAG: phage tail protein [Rhodobacterales bacterium 34-62-10]|nr:MAG: phage tail protein [Rhodobacterales bacterium 34-62-10]
MRLPHLRRRLLLQAPERLPDGAGGYAEIWQTIAELWAEVTPLHAREVAAGGTVLSQTGQRIVVRAAPEGATTRPRPDQRLIEGARIFTILAVTERDPAGRFLTCITREELAP